MIQAAVTLTLSVTLRQYTGVSHLDYPHYHDFVCFSPLELRKRLELLTHDIHNVRLVRVHPHAVSIHAVSFLLSRRGGSYDAVPGEVSQVAQYGRGRGGMAGGTRADRPGGLKPRPGG